MAVLDLIKKVKVQTLSFEKHPCRDLDMETKVHYLNALALVANEDGNIVEKEIEYLTILINSFELDPDTLNEYTEFAKNPDEARLVEMMDAFGTKDIKYNLMVDAMMLAQRDGEFVESEKALIEQYFEMFKISEQEAKDLKFLFKSFYNQDGNALYRYFKRNEYIKVELFQYLLDYYQIDMAYELKEDEKKILTFKFFKPTFEKGGLTDNATEIMIKPVNNAQFCIYLNSAFMDRTIEFNGNGKVVDSKSKDLLMDLDNSDIEFKDNKFIIESAEDDEKKVTGVTYVIANMFIEWVSKYNKEKYQLSSYGTNDNVTDVSSFSNKPLNEIVYSNWINYGNSAGYVITEELYKNRYGFY
jgi:uncharacterized tellurite resistance protein B-like protein